SGRAVPIDATEDVVRALPDPARKLHLVIKDWGEFPSTDQVQNERAAMNILLEHIRAAHPDVTHYFYVDADEVFHGKHLAYLRSILATADRPCEVRGTWR